MAADLLSKEWAVSHGRFVVFNHDPAQLARRLLMSVVAVGVALVIARVAAARGLGRQWGVSVGCALLVAGVLSNGVSRLFWDRGVPDFIHFAGGWMNFADFEILCGLIGGALSVVVAAFAAFARERYPDGRTLRSSQNEGNAAWPRWAGTLRRPRSRQ